MYILVIDDYHSIQFKKSSDEVFKKAQELIHAGVRVYGGACVITVEYVGLVACRIFLYFSVRHRAKRAQDSCQDLPNRSPPSWTAWLSDSKPHSALIRIYLNVYSLFCIKEINDNIFANNCEGINTVVFLK